MRLTEVWFGAYRQFIDERLKLDPDVTVLVGRNDTGKTAVLNQFMRNFWNQHLIGTDAPRLPNVPSLSQKHSLIWELDDSDQPLVRSCFGVSDRIRVLTADFEQRDGNMWSYRGDTATLVPASHFVHREFFPAPAYVYVAGPDGPRDRLPYGNHDTLDRLVEAVRKLNGRAVGVIDTDRRDTENNVAQFRRAGVPCIRLDRFSDSAGTPAAIEDVLGVDDYVSIVNASYSAFGWFSPRRIEEVRKNRGAATLGRYLEDKFAEFGQKFSKVRVATEVAHRMDALSGATRSRLDLLVAELVSNLS